MNAFSAQGGGPELPKGFSAANMGVAFFDLSRLGEWQSSDQDVPVARFFQQFYALAASHIESGGGRIVKVMGDAGFAVFPEEACRDGILALRDLAGEARKLARSHGFDVYLNVNVHLGPVICGPFGPPGSGSFDVIGKTVNIAARLGRRGITLSPQAFRCLDPDSRKLFQKNMPPITYRLFP
jgi:class 3 adenylate cyclase